MLHGTLQDIRYAARRLRQAAAVALAAILTLGVGIGATTAVVSVSTRFGVSPADLRILAAAAVTFVVLGLVAGALPAWRAMRIDPIAALRAE